MFLAYWFSCVVCFYARRLVNMLSAHILSPANSLKMHEHMGTLAHRNVVWHTATAKYILCCVSTLAQHQRMNFHFSALLCLLWCCHCYCHRHCHWCWCHAALDSELIKIYLLKLGTVAWLIWRGRGETFTSTQVESRANSQRSSSQHFHENWMEWRTQNGHSRIK